MVCGFVKSSIGRFVGTFLWSDPALKARGAEEGGANGTFLSQSGNSRREEPGQYDGEDGNVGRKQEEADVMWNSNISSFPEISPLWNSNILFFLMHVPLQTYPEGLQALQLQGVCFTLRIHRVFGGQIESSMHQYRRQLCWKFAAWNEVL